MSSERVVIWTRAESDWDEDRSLLELHGFGGSVVLRVPCIMLRAIPIDGRTFDDCTRGIFTSANAVRYFAAYPEGRAWITVPDRRHYVFGKATKKALREVDSKLDAAVRMPRGCRTARELASFLGAFASREGGKFLVPGPREPAFDMVADLKLIGLEARAVVCYETMIGIPDALLRGTPKDWHPRGVVCFASPSAVRGFTASFPRTPGLIAIAIGPTTMAAARAAGEFAGVRVADENSLESLVAAAAATAQGMQA